MNATLLTPFDPLVEVECPKQERKGFKCGKHEHDVAREQVSEHDTNGTTFSAADARRRQIPCGRLASKARIPSTQDDRACSKHYVVCATPSSLHRIFVASAFVAIALAQVLIGGSIAWADPQPVEGAREALFAAVYKRTHAAESGGLDVFERRCVRRTLGRRPSNKFDCTFKAVAIDRRWVGHGAVRYVGDARWRYNLVGTVEECNGTTCVETDRFRWRGRTITFG